MSKKTKRPPVTLDQVGAAIIDLREEGKQPSVRNIHKRTGGKFNTIIKLRAAWMDIELNEQAAPEIDQDELKILKRLIGKNVRARTAELEGKLESARSDRQEALDLLDEVETALQEANERSAAVIDGLNKERDDLQNVLAETEAQKKDALRQCEELSDANRALNAEILRLTRDEAAAHTAANLFEKQYKDLLSMSRN